MQIAAENERFNSDNGIICIDGILETGTFDEIQGPGKAATHEELQLAGQMRIKIVTF